MLGRLAVAVSLIAGAAGALRADWKITTVVRRVAEETAPYISTTYEHGGLKRIDRQADVQGRPHHLVTVIDRARLRETIWDSELRQYVIIRLRLQAPAPATGPEILIERTTVDQRETRMFFGHPATHLITREVRHARSADGIESEATIDGWYVDVPSLPWHLRAGGNWYLSIGRDTPRFRIHQAGPVPSGLAVLEKRTLVQFQPDGSHITSIITSEVTELAEAPLDAALFRPPANFERVISFPGDPHLSWTERLRRRWELMEDWVAGFMG